MDLYDQTSNEGIKSNVSFLDIRQVLLHKVSLKKELCLILQAALWQFQSNLKKLPEHVEEATQLGQIANALLQSADLNKQANITAVPVELIE
jgi:hypothetical protein